MRARAVATNSKVRVKPRLNHKGTDKPKLISKPGRLWLILLGGLRSVPAALGHMHVNSPLREHHSKKAKRELPTVLVRTTNGGFHADPDISCCCCSNAGVSVSDAASPGGSLSDSFLRLRRRIRRVWRRALLARRADRSSSNLAIRPLPGQRSGCVHSGSNHARSNKRYTSLKVVNAPARGRCHV